MSDENILLRDSTGVIRLDERLRFTLEQTRDLEEFIFVKTGQIVKIKSLDVPFVEYDGGIKTNRGMSRRWTNPDREHVLLHYKEEYDVIGKGIGRSFMSIKFQISDLITEFDEWCEDNADKIVKLSRPERITMFLKEEY